MRAAEGIGPARTADLDNLGVHPGGLGRGRHDVNLHLVFDNERQPGGQRGAGLMQAGLDRPEADPELQCGLGVGQAGPVEGEHGRSLARRQGRHCLAHLVCHLSGFGLLVRTWAVVATLFRQR